MFLHCWCCVNGRWILVWRKRWRFSSAWCISVYFLHLSLSIYWSWIETKSIDTRTYNLIWSISNQQRGGTLLNILWMIRRCFVPCCKTILVSTFKINLWGFTALQTYVGGAPGRGTIKYSEPLSLWVSEEFHKALPAVKYWRSGFILLFECFPESWEDVDQEIPLYQFAV